MPYSQYGTQEQWQTNHGNIGIHDDFQTYHPNLPVTAYSVSQSPVKFYKIGDYIGHETRQFEFKEGQGDIEKNLLYWRQKRSLAAYVSGFLNSVQAGGIILVGVNDNGIVVGIRCNHQKKDRLGLLISKIMRSELDPPVVPQQYSVRFVPVCDEQGVYQINDRYVLEIAVYRLVNITELYKASGEVYRRDEGCLNGPLGSDEISKWLKLLHQIESENNQNKFNLNQSYVQRLKEAKEQLEKEKEQMATDIQLQQIQLQEQENKIKQRDEQEEREKEELKNLLEAAKQEKHNEEREKQTLELENRVLQDKLVQAEKLSRTKTKNSKVCVIM